MFSQPSWYRKAEAWLEPFWPLMLALAAIIIVVTLYFAIQHKRLPMAAWLTYLYMP